MSTTTNPPAPPANQPDADLPQQQQFMQSAQEYNAVYTKEQETLATLQTEISSMDSWADLIQVLGTLSCLVEWMSATQIFTESCASALAGLMQGAESIFTDGINYINELSEEEFASDPSTDNGVPIVDPETLNSEFSTQVNNAQTFIYYLQDIYYDVSGAAFTAGNNPLEGISTSVENTLQDFMYQMVSTFNEMYNNVNTQGGVGNTYYVPPSGGTGSSGSYASNGSGNNYLFDPTQYTDSSSTSPMEGASGADVVCYAMLNWFYTYATQVTYSSGVTSEQIYAPEMTQNPDAYQVTTDFQSFTSTVMGVSQQVLPLIAFLSNLDKNVLSTLYNAFKTQASVIKDIIANSRGS